ncbi:unnamed protein product [Cyprideis torosa]|uniref:Uncharacterized protein n=1 Tax=Cyprideis torosa TaxID=163714 RepID=A0A7R8WH71_9CRUS|nr:unnamed protein product [Cyprideis torosa]CAG0892946.1 unnamed protein product [Cyprideis torosa]
MAHYGFVGKFPRTQPERRKYGRTYAVHLSKQLSIRNTEMRTPDLKQRRYGKPLLMQDLEAFNDEQILQLYELMQEAKKPDPGAGESSDESSRESSLKWSGVGKSKLRVCPERFGFANLMQTAGARERNHKPAEGHSKEGEMLVSSA